MFNPDNLDPREQEIYDTADAFWATRFMGSGAYDKLGPFPTQLDVVKAVLKFFEDEVRHYPPPEAVMNRPFAIYAASTKHGDAHIVLGTLYRDGKRGVTQREVSQRVQEEKKLGKATGTRRRRNT